MKKLTDTQNNILVFIKQYFNQNLCSPTFQEIADNFTMTRQGATDHVRKLEKNGYVTVKRGEPRSIKINEE